MVRFLVVLALVGCGSKKSQDVPPAGSGSAPAAAVPAPDAADGKAAAFWSWFQAHAAELSADKDPVHLMNTVSAEVERAAPGVIGEIAADPKTGEHALVLSADGIRDKFGAVQALYAARPAHLPAGWKVQAFRPRDAGFTVEMGDMKLDPKTAKFVASQNDDKLDIQVFLPAFKDDDEHKQGAFILLDHTVGEFDMETKIGVIDFAGIDKAPSTAKPLSELPAAVDALPR